MKVLFVNQALVHELLPIDVCIQQMRLALATFSGGGAVQPLRSVVRLPDGSGVLGLMPGYLENPLSLGLKVVSVMPGNRGTPYESHQGLVVLLGVKHGEPVAVMDATAITSIRTAAASAVASDELARADAGDLALIGAGTEARTHLAALAVVRRLRRVRIWNRTRERAVRFASDFSSTAGVEIEVMQSAQEAVRGADLVCTLTGAREPVVCGEWLANGAHVNAVGACFPSHRELDTQAILRARLYTDSRESCMNESGDFRFARAEGAITDGHLLGELGEVLLGKLAGRVSAADITVYESLGIAIEDLASAHAIYERALSMGKGVWLDWSGEQQS